MAKVNLKQQTNYQRNSFEPVVLSDGTTVSMAYEVDGEKKSMNGSASKDGKEVALFRVNPDSNRLFIQVQPLDSVGSTVAAEILDTLVAAIQEVFK